MDSRIGTVLDGRYKILDRIAAGGMGVVYKGERLKLERSVAIKFLHAWMATDDSFKKRFEIEAMAMAKLQHPNCTSVTDFGIDAGEPYVVMDFVPGQSLRRLLDREPMTVARAIEIARQVLAGLAHAHTHGITHRDIKPDNIMVDTSSSQFGDQVRILDFGLAKMRESSGLTTGFVVGTPAYMAPEQTMGNPVDERTDVYAVGVLLFEMLSGKKPFVAEEAAEVIRMHRMEAPPRLAAMAAPGASFSAELQAVVDRALAKDAGHRYQSAADFAAALDGTPEAAQTRAPSSSDARAALGIAETAMLESDALIPVSSPGMAMATPAPGTVPTQHLGVATSHQPASPTSHLGPVTSQRPLGAPLNTPLPQAAALVSPDASQVNAQMMAAHAGSGVAPQSAYVSTPGMAVDPRMPNTGGYAPVPPARPRRTLGVVVALGVVGLLVAVAVWASQGPSDEAAATGATTELGDGEDTAQAASEKAAKEQAAREKAAKEQAAREKAAREKAAREQAAREKAAAEGDNATPPSGDAAEPPEFTRIKERIKAGNTRGATRELEKLKRKYRSNAEIPYVLGQLYFGKLWVIDGLEAFREAIVRNPDYRSDALLIKSTIIGLANDSHNYKVRRFLVREIGQPAVPHLEDAAKNHNSPRIRERAQRALREIQ